jgi:Tol biopolymer transport system component
MPDPTGPAALQASHRQRNPRTDPRWSPDGWWLAWSRSVGVRPDGVLTVMTVDTRTVRQVALRGEQPALQPGGRRIVFAAGGSLYSIRSDGRARTRLTTGPHDANPDWRWH